MSVRSLNNSLVLSKDSEELFQTSLINSASTFYYIQYIFLAHNIAYLAKNFGSIHPQHHYMRYSYYYVINPKYHQYLVKSSKVSKKEVNQSVNNTITNDITSFPNEINIAATTKNFPFLSTISLPNISKDFVLFAVTIL